MPTPAEVLVDLSDLLSGTPAEHLLSITQGTGTGVGDLVIGFVTDDQEIVGVLGQEDRLVGISTDESVVGVVGSGESVTGVAFDDDPVIGEVE